MFKYQGNGRANQEPSRLNHILGFYEVNPFHQTSQAELESDLQKTNLVEIQKMAAKVGLVPTSDRKKLCKAIVGKYQDFVRLCGVREEKQKFDPSEYDNH